MISFGEWCPELLLEWSKKNETDPFEISYGSNKKVLWKGFCGHEWEATVKNRSNGHGCPYCSGNRVLKGFNDLPTHYPELVKEWSELNHPKKPEDYTKRSTHYAWWKCPECGYQWKARIADRAEGHGCPVCAGEKLVPEINSLAALKPELAEEWSPKNSGLPDTVFPRSRKMAWWICKRCGFEWEAVINTRVKGQKCPECETRTRRAIHEEKIHIKREAERRRRSLPMKLIRDYSENSGHTYRYMDDSVIGIPLQFFYPDVSSAIEVSLPGQQQAYKYERTKNWLCLNAGIRLVRILRPGDAEYDNCICISMEEDSEETLQLAVAEALSLIGRRASACY